MTDPAGETRRAEDVAFSWSTADVDHRDRLGYWTEAVCEAFFELKVSSEAGADFEGSAHLRPLGPLNLIFMQLGHQHITRTPGQIGRSSAERYQLIQYRNLPGLVRQFGREAWVKPGGFTLVDVRHPFTIDNADGQDALSIALPASWLEGWVPSAPEATAQAWGSDSGWASTLSALLAQLAPEINGGLPLPGSVSSEQIGALLALTMGAKTSADGGAPADVSLLARLRDGLRGLCHEGDLTAERLGRLQDLTARQVHWQFAAAGSSFGAELLALRLEGARRMLADRRFADIEIDAVAGRWGFGDLVVFRTAFLRRFSEHASTFRARVHGKARF